MQTSVKHIALPSHVHVEKQSGVELWEGEHRYVGKVRYAEGEHKGHACVCKWFKSGDDNLSSFVYISSIFSIFSVFSMLSIF